MKLKFILFVALIMAINVGIFAQKATSNTEPVKVGVTAPDFTLTSNGKEDVTLSKVNKPTVLVFYRGYW